MDPTLGNNQNKQSQERQSGGGLINPLGNIVSRKITRQVVVGGLRALLMNPWALPLIFTIGLILLFTIGIVAGPGSPSSETSNQTTNETATESITPAAIATTPTESPTPTPPAGP